MMQKYKVFIDNHVLIVTDSDKKIDNTESYNVLHSNAIETEGFVNNLKTNTAVISNTPDVTFKKLFLDYQTVEAAGCLVQNNNNKFLVIKRLGLWDLPKGKLEKGELIPDCAGREVEEETGVPVSVGPELITTYHTYYRNGHVLKPTYWFAAQASKDVELIPQIEEDIEDVQWMTKENILEKVFPNTYPAIRDVFMSFESKL